LIGKGERRPELQWFNKSGINTNFYNIGLTLHGGGTSNINDFGGRGGSFVYDYWGRIKYNKDRPQDGKLLITYLGPLGIALYTITVNKGNNITKIDYPFYKSSADTREFAIPASPLDIKVLLVNGYEIDIEESTVYYEGIENDKNIENYDDIRKDDGSIPLGEYAIKMYVDNFLKQVKAIITDIDYYNVQTITFPMPTKNIIINLKTKRIKYKIRLITDRYIEKCDVTIGVDTIDLLEKDAYATSNSTIALGLTYFDDNHLINKDVFCHYLCIKPGEIEYSDKDQQNTQMITFKMPARNILLRIATDATYFLTIEIDERQELDEKEKLPEEQRFIKSPVILKFIREGKEEKISEFPKVYLVKRGDKFDLYVQFDTLYQHLDKSYIYSQKPNAGIEEAGNFLGHFDLQSTRLIPHQQLPNVITDNNKEWFQHIRFTMPSNNLIIHLKWEERIFQIEYDIQAAYFISTVIKDSNRLIDLYSPPREKQVTMRQSIFPHYTYSVVSNNTDYQRDPYDNGRMSRQNTIEIISKLKQYMKLKRKTSTFRIGFPMSTS
jgi:hypothetical protein